MKLTSLIAIATIALPLAACGTTGSYHSGLSASALGTDSGGGSRSHSDRSGSRKADEGKPPKSSPGSPPKDEVKDPDKDSEPPKKEKPPKSGSGQPPKAETR